ncbi:MAG: hypothetical protein EA421_00525 [Gemmatimonadales bacterium]|nr:MAG: hypothetical protein EA421_00525 [Gemmatimonadales bacterium]
MGPRSRRDLIPMVLPPLVGSIRDGAPLPTWGALSARRPGIGVGVVLLMMGALLLVPAPSEAQLAPVNGYYLHALAGSESSPFSASGVIDVQRLRLMTRPTWGAARFDIAWETTLSLRSDELALGRGFEGAEPAAPWLDLQGHLVDRRRVEWTHGLDRLNVSIQAGEQGRLTLGRQPISWATTLYFTPADPFVPFDPTDPFREYRAGVDALRGVLFTGPFSELDAVIRPAPAPSGGESWTALLRGQRLLEGWEVSAWGGMLHDEAAGALAAAGSIGEWGLRGEGSLRRTDDGTVVRAALGLDRLFDLVDRDFRAVVELQHDGFGARRAADLLDTALSLPAARGELSVLGRDALAANASWQVHPLTSVSLLTLVSLRDGSSLVSPGVTWSLADEVSLRLGAFAGIGPGADPTRLRSEHGATPLIGFAALSAFF